MTKASSVRTLRRSKRYPRFLRSVASDDGHVAPVVKGVRGHHRRWWFLGWQDRRGDRGSFDFSSSEQVEGALRVDVGELPVESPGDRHQHERRDRIIVFLDEYLANGIFKGHVNTDPGAVEHLEVNPVPLRGDVEPRQHFDQFGASGHHRGSAIGVGGFRTMNSPLGQLRHDSLSSTENSVREDRGARLNCEKDTKFTVVPSGHQGW